jgi:translation initiation factor 2 beta subunit (eIF-2beta)/eIF-5
MRTDEAGIMHAYRCPHCDSVEAWEIGLRDERREWFTKCSTCGADVVIRYDPARDVVTGFAP